MSGSQDLRDIDGTKQENSSTDNLQPREASRRVYLAEVQLPKADLEFANLQGIDLRNANLQEGILIQADLQNAILLRADLQKIGRAHV